jgi:predicted PurR-regulated permease PerM
VTEYLKQSASWLAGHLGAFFAGTASTLFLVFISIIGSFYLFRDGEHFTRGLVRISPLPDTQDAVIMDRLARAVRSVATGTVLIAIIQGTLTALGLWIFGFERAVLWGLVAAFGALIPGVGTMIVFAPAVAYLAFAGEYFELVGVAVWGVAAVPDEPRQQFASIFDIAVSAWGNCNIWTNWFCCRSSINESFYGSP